MKYLVEFLIPTYKRFNGAIEAAMSVSRQIDTYNLSQQVKIRVVDDNSPNFRIDIFKDKLGSFLDYIEISINEYNKGMSKNIYDLTTSSSAEFCTVLTDDDYLQPGALPEIVSELEVLNPLVCGLFTPRYSYTEDGKLHFIACKPKKSNMLIKSGCVNSIRYAHNGFILTGFIMRTSKIAKAQWKQNIKNAYFPVINFGSILLIDHILFVNKNWFYHTVLNEVHWDSWGKNEYERAKRLNQDYLDAITYISTQALINSKYYLEKLLIYSYELSGFMRYLNNVQSLRYIDVLRSASRHSKVRLTFIITYVISYPIYYLKRIKRMIIISSL